MHRIAVIGAGAMGGLWAARLAAAGHQTTIVDVSSELIEAVRERGLTVQDGEVTVTGRPAARLASDDTSGEHDIVFVFVKGPHTRAAAASVPALLAPAGTVVSLQNGWGHADVLAETIDPPALVVGVTYEGARVLEPGRVSHDGHGGTFVGPYVDGSSLDRAKAVAGAMSGAGLPAEVTAGIKTDIWRKLVHNASCLAISALTGLRTSELVEPGAVRDLLDALAREAVEVARAQGYDIDAAERIERIHTVLAGAGLGTPSMLADALAQRQTEIDTINGAVVRAAAQVGMSAPLNEAMVALVRGLETRWSS